MKKVLLSLLLFSIALFLSNCERNDNSPVNKDKTYLDGFAIVQQNCISCHSPKKGMKNRIAPPLFALKNHYLERGMQENEFVNTMVSFLEKPNIKNSKMPRAVEKFGLMPNLGMSKEQYKAVATYIFRAKLEKPGWYEKHHAEEEAALLKHSEPEDKDNIKKGLNIALATKAVLGKNLLNAIKTKGTDQALSFCNERAIPLTDSMAVELDAKIKRVSDKNRNPNNAANESELAYIQQAKSEIAADGKASPQIQEIDNKTIGYYPIMTNDMCLQCHGKPTENIDEKTLEVIQSKYPKDKAIGYSRNELRGIWVIEMAP